MIFFNPVIERVPRLQRQKKVFSKQQGGKFKGKSDVSCPFSTKLLYLGINKENFEAVICSFAIDGFYLGEPDEDKHTVALVLPCSHSSL